MKEEKQSLFQTFLILTLPDAFWALDFYQKAFYFITNALKSISKINFFAEFENIVRIMIENGADINLINNDGKSKFEKK